MKFFVMMVGTLIILLVLYYVTWMIHVITPIFGKWVDPVKAIIPFYGWVKLFQGPKFF